MALTLDPRSTALILIDLQNGIVSRPLDPHDANTVVANGVKLANALSEKGGLVIPVHVGFSDDDRDRLKSAIDQPMPGGTMPADWSELVPEIAALNATIIIRKRNWSAFHGTELDLQLRRRGIKTIILGGIATNFGVESTAREGWQYGYEIVVAEDASSSSGGEGLHAFAIDKIFPRLSRVRSTAEIVAAL
ncbi:MAG TPA: hydrolase [Gemmatimonadaceae bacterium]